MLLCSLVGWALPEMDCHSLAAAGKRPPQKGPPKELGGTDGRMYGRTDARETEKSEYPAAHPLQAQFGSFVQLDKPDLGLG